MDISTMRSFYGAIIVFLLLISTTRAYFLQNQFVNQFLLPQNAARAALGLLPLVWDTRLERYAQWYASQRQQDCALIHSNGPYGENIFWGSGDGWTGAQAAASWVCEKKWYDHNTNSCAEGEDCGHYTQVVWVGTRRVGCARVVCDGGLGVFMTCNYDPPGNYMGEKPY
ncbi:hypothetical protein PTKIN_Ptkin11bG0132600 [Pterospermum kingtungense]